MWFAQRDNRQKCRMQCIRMRVFACMECDSQRNLPVRCERYRASAAQGEYDPCVRVRVSLVLCMEKLYSVCDGSFMHAHVLAQNISMVRTMHTLISLNLCVHTYTHDYFDSIRCTGSTYRTLSYVLSHLKPHAMTEQEFKKENGQTKKYTTTEDNNCHKNCRVFVNIFLASFFVIRLDMKYVFICIILSHCIHARNGFYSLVGCSLAHPQGSKGKR